MTSHPPSHNQHTNHKKDHTAAAASITTPKTINSFLQRCAILHLSLVQCSTGSSSGLDEGAALPELAESILYYYSSSGCNDDDDDDDKEKDRESPAAVRLAGLATAFWSLPAALSLDHDDTPNSNKQQSSKSQQQPRQQPSYQCIRLTNCTLVITLLEPPYILSIGQFHPRAHVTATAMAAALYRHYQLFRLVGGGSIHRRLLQQPPASSSSPSSSSQQQPDQSSNDDRNHDQKLSGIYPGMKQLFALYRARRKLFMQQQQEHNDHDPRPPASAVDTAAAPELEQYRSTLPIAAVREELRQHFDLFWCEWIRCRAVNPACARSLCHVIPPPVVPAVAAAPKMVAAPTATSRSINNPPPPPRIMNWKNRLEHFLERVVHPTGTILGISVFTQGRFAETIVAATSSFSLCVRVETACLLLQYLSSIRQSLARSAQHPEPAASGFLRRTLGGFLPAPSAEAAGAATTTFLKPPPLSMLSTTVHEISSCCLPGNNSNCSNNNDPQVVVWTPMVTLDDDDAAAEHNHARSAASERSVRVCLCHVGPYDFVLYLDPEKEDNFPSVLQSFASSLNETTTTTTTTLFVPAAISRVGRWDRAGQDILWVDRTKQTTVLYSSRKPPPVKKSTSQHHHHPDERYQLASHLSLDTVLALDDAMKHATAASPTCSRYDMCTLLRHFWLVCKAQNGRELYVILDAKLYVTIQDVTRAVEEIEQHFIVAAPDGQ